jgi:hypothetical protein
MTRRRANPTARAKISGCNRLYAGLASLADRSVLEHFIQLLRRLLARSPRRGADVISTKLALSDFAWLLNSAPVDPPPQLVRSSAVDHGDDLSLVERVMTAYKRSFEQYRATASFWDVDLANLKRDIHSALIGADNRGAAKLLHNPADTTLFWGFDAIAKAPPGTVEPHEYVIKMLNQSEDWQALYALWLMNGLRSVAEALGARRVSYLETEPAQVGMHERSARTTDQILDQIDAAIGLKLHFPNPFSGELGLPSNRGVVGFRSIHAIYQAWRIAQISKGRPDFKVMEIGAGLGRTAYFANNFGIKNYTIVDIPLTNAAQGYFLGRVLGPEAVRLNGEDAEGQLHIMCASDIETCTERFDLIINIDSWTEMSREAADSYWQFARRATNAALSINHEHNAFTVRDIYSKDADVTATRFPYWTRRGYVEEFITW